MSDCTTYPPDPACMGTGTTPPPLPAAAPLPGTGGDTAAAVLVWLAVVLFLAGVAIIAISNRR
jgi:LPXTG-motif cell wall-anchored protein